MTPATKAAEAPLSAGTATPATAGTPVHDGKFHIAAGSAPRRGIAVTAARALGTLADYGRVLVGPSDLLRYLALRRRYARGAAGGAAQPLRVRPLGGAAVLCRPSQDVWTFKHTFLHGFHLPPVPLREDAAILDLGSNVGYTVAHLAHVHPRARVIGVELDRANAELARRNTARYGDRVTVLHAAVWTRDGEVAYTGEADDAFHVVEGAPPSGDGRTVPALRIATILDRFGLDRVDYVKMDVEGAEAALLAEPLDWARRVRSLKVEVHPPVSLPLLRATLERHGFRCWVDAAHGDCLCAVRD